jgi:hypothetical protein
LVYRPGFSRALYVVFVVFVVWWAVDAAMNMAPGPAVVTVLWLLAVSAALACLFWRPAVLVDDAGVELKNVLRDVRVPWQALEEIETRYTLTLYCGGRRYQSWAGAAPGRPSITGRLLGGGAGALTGGPARHDQALPDPRWTSGGGTAAAASSRDLRADSGATAFMIEQRWEQWRTTAGRLAPTEDARAEVSWRLRLPLVVGAAGVLATAGTLLVGA